MKHRGRQPTNGIGYRTGIHVRLSETERRQLEQRAAATGQRQLSEVIRQALRAYLELDQVSEAKA